MCWRHWRPGLPCATGTHYDGYGRLDQMIMPSPTTPGANAPCHVPYASGDDCEVYGYDSAGNMTSKRNRSGLSIAMVYDALSRETSRTVPDNPAYAGNYARTLTSTYDLASRMWDLTADGQTLRNRYDTAGRQNQVQDSLLNALGGTIGNVGYGYDAASNRTSVAFDASQGTWTTTSTFDTGERLATVVNAGSTLAQLGYDPLARLTGTTFLDSSSVGYAYEADDDLQTLTQNFTAGTLTLGYTRNGAHQIIGLTVTDPTYLMKQVGASASYVPNGLNQYTQVAGTALTYDTNGNLIGDGTSTYSFDEENRLRQAVTGGVTSVYAYDPMGRRRSKTVGSTTTYFVNDGANELAELSSTGIRQRSWAYAVGMDNRIAMYDDAGGTGWRFYHVNHQGSVLFTTRQSTGGAIADQYQYGAYGEPLPGAPASINPFRYTGRYLDSESGLYYYRARFYSPKLGRFLQTDPVGTKDDLNLYAYVYNDAVDRVDPTGLAEKKSSGDSCTGTRIKAACGQFGNGGEEQGPELRAKQSTSTQQASSPASQAPMSSPRACALVGQCGPNTIPLETQITFDLLYGGLIVGLISGADAALVGSVATGGEGAVSIGTATEVANATAAGSRYANIATNLTARNFQENLVANGYRVVRQTTGSNGPVTMLSNGDKTYTIYTATSTGSASAQVTNALGEILSKIRFSGL